MSAQRASQLVEAGLWLRLSGDHEGAKRLFEQALKLDPANARARQLLDAPPPVAPQASGPASKAAELDWGMATGRTQTPPPVPPAEPPPLQKSNTRPFGEGAPPGTHTVRLGDMTMPDIPEAPRFEDPHGEVMITGADEEPPPDNSTLVFGMSGVPVPPAPSSQQAPAGGTMVFSGSGGGKPQAPPSVPPVAPVGGTLVFGNKDRDPPSVAPVVGPGSGTLMFSGTKESQSQSPSQPQQGGTMSFSGSSREAPPAPQQGGPGGTMVFGSSGGSKEAPPAQPRGVGASTMMFAGKQDAAPSVPPVGPGNSTMVFGAQGSNAPPAVAPVRGGQPSTMMFGSTPPLSREMQVVTEPGLPSFAADDFRESQLKPAANPGGSSTGTLEFNFDDMVSVPGPVPSPPVPYDKEDGPQTAWDRSNPRIDISQIEPGEGGGFDLISAAPPPPPKTRSAAQLKEEVATLLSGAKDLLDLDDHSGAMELISKALELDPADAAALKLKDRSERTLQAMYESKLGDLNQTPRVKLKDDEIIWLNLDHRAGFVLAQIDGSVTFEDLFAVSGMSRLDTGRILAQLVEEGVISKG